MNKNTPHSLLDRIFSNYGDMYSKVLTLSAIWLNQAIVTTEGLRRRISPGMGIKVSYGKLVDLPDDEQPTHKVLHCMGTLADTNFQLVLIDLKNNEPLTINL